MAKEATFKIYNGTSWEEYTFPPSTHTHSEYATNTRVNDLELAIGNKSRVTLNGSATTSPSFYAPTSAGTAGQVLVSNGSGAPKWESLDISSSGSTSCNQYYGTCSTGSSTTAKVVVCTGFTLTTGARISVKFTNYNTATSPTLNVNSTGAKAIKEYGTTASYMTYRWASGGVVGFVYDGNYWIIEQPRIATTTYYGLSRCDRVTLNGSTSSSPSFYAPTSAGTSGQILVSNGSGAPKWSALPDADNLYLTSGESIEEAIDSMDSKISNLEQNSGSSGGSGGSSTFAYLAEFDIMVDEWVDIATYIDNYNELWIQINITCDASTQFGLCNGAGQMSTCSLYDDYYTTGVMRFNKTNDDVGLWTYYTNTISASNSNNASDIVACSSDFTYIGNTSYTATSVEMNIKVYGR